MRRKLQFYTSKVFVVCIYGTFVAGLKVRVCNEKFIYLFLCQNSYICCWYFKEWSHIDGSFKHSKQMFEQMKKIFTIFLSKFFE